MLLKATAKFQKLSERYGPTASQFDVHHDLAKELLTTGEQAVSVTDLIVLSTLKRSLELVAGIIVLVEQWNFGSAGALLRLQIDNLLKLTYLFEISDPAREALS